MGSHIYIMYVASKKMQAHTDMVFMLHGWLSWQYIVFCGHIINKNMKDCVITE